MSLFLAIDAGWTKTVCCIADETRELARATTGTVRLMVATEDEATERLVSVVTDAAKAAGISLEDVTRTCMAVGGLSIEPVRQWATNTLASLVSGEVILAGEEEIGIDAAFQGGAGILVIAGAGSHVVARAADGELYSAGGWGPALGDEGSAYWIGQEAVKTALWGLDRGISSKLLGAIQEAWGADTVGDVVTLGNVRPGPDFAALAPVVAWCAEEEDDLALALLVRAGEELASLVGLVRLKMEESGAAGVVEVAITGSVLEQIRMVRESMVETLEEDGIEVKVQERAVDSLEGALWRARGGERA
ncbi:BadF/BadG/BcrA/BcrD ATPase family protein [Granulicella sibirica]|uniref:Kinase similar to eukaryotic-like N-acetylglucosamine kinase n=1 Tax=Granulicella sibirica TaxID=2479048 RepID=A0A4Q0SV64_9BACT|nr:BadF/BadG/BcrA/BcrD ATPase family protein [Granulicella sibirica]RXH54953.1 Kinase similar to eukaryotic-like N-acetylglucosamine kinase [Granulicella sibirica]